MRKYKIVISNRRPRVIPSRGSQVAEGRYQRFGGRGYLPLELSTALGRPGPSFEESSSPLPPASPRPRLSGQAAQTYAGCWKEGSTGQPC